MKKPTRVAILTAMQIELDPIVHKLGLTTTEEGVYRGNFGTIEVTALLTNMGMAAGAAAAEKAIALDVDRVLVVGIAGGLIPDTPIGTVIRPEIVFDRMQGTAYHPLWPDGVKANGILSSSDDFITDDAMLDAMRRDGVIALDMETAAVAATCDNAGVAWSVHRSISDRPSDGLLDEAIWFFTHPDGSADPAALAEYLSGDPLREGRLAQLARDTEIATNACADDAIATLR